jgi:hypothetical protein
MAETATTSTGTEIAGTVIQGWTSIGWPQAALLLGLVFLILFRKPIASFISRLTSIGKAGATASLSPVQPTASEESPKIDAANKTDFIKEYPAFSSVQREAVRKELAGLSQSEVQAYLVDHLVFVRTLYLFENKYAYIYAGQIKFMKLLNERQVVGVMKSDLDGLWREHQRGVAPALDTWSCEVYLAYLYVNGFIFNEGEVVKISMVGIEFLMWMTRNGRAESQKSL